MSVSKPGWVPAPDSFVYVPRSEITGSYKSFCFIFLRNHQSFSHSGCTSLHFYQQSTRVPFLRAPIMSYHLLVWILGILGGAVLSRGFDFWFPGNQWCWASSHELIDHLYVFGEMSSQALCPLWTGLPVFLLLSCRGSSDIPDISLLSEIWFAIIFSHFVNCHFIQLGILRPSPSPQILNFGEV